MIVRNIFLAAGWLLSLGLAGQVQFRERAVEAGLAFTYGEVQLMGGGAAAFDYDLDGDEDLYVTGGSYPDALFRNDGTGNFTNVAAEVGIADITRSVQTTSVVTGDLDNDGRREIFVGTVGPAGVDDVFLPNLLLRFDPAAGKYVDVAELLGLRQSSFCLGAQLADFNQDGLLDLYVLNYVEAAAVTTSGGQLTGFDHECGRNALYRNDFPRAAFEDQSKVSGFDQAMYGMGIALGDYDGDLDLDYYVTNIGGNRFYENDGHGGFRERAAELGVADTFSNDPTYLSTGWGTFFADVDNDSYPDLFVANGFVNSSLDADGIHQPDRLFLGGADHHFREAAVESGIDFEGLSRGAVHADFNGDGRLDIVTVTNDILLPGHTNFIQYYENRSSGSNHWASFRLEGQRANRDGVGAWAILHAGGRKFLRESSSGGSHASQSSGWIHFGLGEIGTLDSVEVYWPGGQRESYADLAVDQRHYLQQRYSRTIPTTTPQSQGDSLTLSFNAPEQVVEVAYLGDRFQPATLLVSDILGRVLARQEFLLANGTRHRLSVPTAGGIIIARIDYGKEHRVRKFFRR